MNRTQMEGNWKQIKGKAQKTWGNVTDDDLEKAKGDYQQLVGKIQERTGEARERIEEQLEEFGSEAEAERAHQPSESSGDGTNRPR